MIDFVCQIKIISSMPSHSLWIPQVKTMETEGLDSEGSVRWELAKIKMLLGDSDETRLSFLKAGGLPNDPDFNIMKEQKQLQIEYLESEEHYSKVQGVYWNL
jgi:hypothetical protein